MYTSMYCHSCELCLVDSKKDVRALAATKNVLPLLCAALVQTPAIYHSTLSPQCYLQLHVIPKSALGCMGL